MSSRCAVWLSLVCLTACAQQEVASPLADAGPGVHGRVGQGFTLDGAGSGGGALAWWVVEAPAGARPRLDAADTPWPTLWPDTPGVYTLALQVCGAAGCAEGYTFARVGPAGPGDQHARGGPGADPLGLGGLGLHWMLNDPDPLELRFGFVRKGGGFLPATAGGARPPWARPGVKLGQDGATAPGDLEGPGDQDARGGPGADPLGLGGLAPCWGVNDHDPLELRFGFMGKGRGFLPATAGGTRPPWARPGVKLGQDGATAPGGLEGPGAQDARGGPGADPLGLGGLAPHWGLNDDDPLELRRGAGLGPDGALEEHDPLELGAGLGPAGDNEAPVASAQAALGAGGEVTLQGSASHDPDGDALRYRWRFLSVPAGTALGEADLVGATSDTATFTPDIPGTWVLVLVVSDGRGWDTARVVVTAP